MKNAELQNFRRLIRERNGLPDPPRPAWSELVLEATTAADPAPVAESQTDEPPVVEPVAIQAAAPTPAPAAAPAQDAVPADALDPEWRPDALIHRLVQLVMEMRELSERDRPALSEVAAQAA